MSTNVQPVGSTGPREVADDARFQDLAGLSVASQVMAIRGACRQLRVEGQSGELRSTANERQQHIEERLEAMQRAEEAQGDAGFWGKVADVMETAALVAAVVVGVAGSVFTGGASGVAAGVLFALVTAATTAAPYAGEYIASATNMSPEATMGLTIGIAAACIAAAVFNPGAAATSTTNVATATSRMGSALTQAAVIAERMGQSAEVVGRFMNGYSGCMAGLAAIEEGAAAADAQRSEAASIGASQRRDDVMGRIEEASREAARAARQVMQTVELEEQTSQAVVRA